MYSTEKYGRYAAEHGPNEVSQHFTVPESTAHLLKKQYLTVLNNRRQSSATIPEVTHLPTKPRGHPLLLGSTLDDHVKEYVTPL